VSTDAAAQDIRKGSHRAALAHHPDRNVENAAQAEAKFNEIHEAHEVLGNRRNGCQHHYFTDHRGRQTVRTRMHTVLGNDWDDFAYYNFEEIPRIFPALNFHGTELSVEHCQIYRKFRRRYQSSRADTNIDRKSTYADFNSPLKVGH